MNTFNIEPNELYAHLIKMRELESGVFYLSINDFDGRLLNINSKQLLNFTNCCYLGIEKHQKLISGAIEAVEKYGSQISTTRVMVSCPLYKEIDLLLSDIYPGEPIVYSSSTLAHYSAMPILMTDKDAIILDAFAHNSIKTSSMLCKANGAFVISSKHNDMDFLRYLIKRLKKEGYKKIWYCADSIYSMHGDVCDIAELIKILNEEENFYAYVDDAHGIGWTGKNGCGYVIGNFGLHKKMIVTGSLSKSIGVTGGFLIVPDKDLADYIKLTSNSFIFSIPMPPSSLGAIKASLELHLSNEIVAYQSEFNDLLKHFHAQCKKLAIKTESNCQTPIAYVTIGNSEKTFLIHKLLIDKGFCSSIAAYPAINRGGEGIRIQLSRHLTELDLDNYLNALKELIVKHSN